ncbi:MAG: hypothetical protein VB036_10360 [Propionicimonas sp.]|nr:hypothetical protein [Propionicimonas sp.]
MHTDRKGPTDGVCIRFDSNVVEQMARTATVPHTAVDSLRRSQPLHNRGKHEHEPHLADGLATALKDDGKR